MGQIAVLIAPPNAWDTLPFLLRLRTSQDWGFWGVSSGSLCSSLRDSQGILGDRPMGHLAVLIAPPNDSALGVLGAFMTPAELWQRRSTEK